MGKKAIKTTEKCLESELKVQLFVEILEKIYNLKNYGYDAATLEPLQAQIMQKIDDENLSSESIETHLKKIRALLSGEKSESQVDDVKPTPPEPTNEEPDEPTEQPANEEPTNEEEALVDEVEPINESTPKPSTNEQPEKEDEITTDS